jgi:hypothetical protein
MALTFVSLSDQSSETLRGILFPFHTSYKSGLTSHACLKPDVFRLRDEGSGALSGIKSNATGVDQAIG